MTNPLSRLSILLLALMLTACARPIPTLVIFPSPTPSVTPTLTPTATVQINRTPAEIAVAPTRTQIPLPTQPSEFATDCQADLVFYANDEAEALAMSEGPHQDKGLWVACIFGSEVLFTESFHPIGIYEAAVSAQSMVAVRHGQGIQLFRYPSKAREVLVGDELITTMVEYGLTWSPDGAYLAYFAPDSPDLVLDILHLQARTVSATIDLPSYPRRAVWSPDGTKIAVATFDDRLYVANISCDAASNQCTTGTLDEIVLIDETYALGVANILWLPDRSGLLLSCYSGQPLAAPDLCSTDLTGQTALVFDGAALGFKWIYGAALSPDGSRLIFAGAPDDQDLPDTDLYHYSFADQTLTRLTDTPDYDEKVIWWVTNP